MRFGSLVSEPEFWSLKIFIDLEWYSLEWTNIGRAGGWFIPFNASGIYLGFQFPSETTRWTAGKSN